MTRYFVEFQIGTSVEAESEEEAIELASYEINLGTYDNVNVTKED